MNNIKISVITVCYNAEKTIERTIKSVIDQDYSNYEYILVDGKSTDKTMDIVNKYKNSFSKIISEKDKGISDAFNKGISLASGDIIGLINADDYYLPEAFNNIANNYEKKIILYGNLLVPKATNDGTRIKKANVNSWKNLSKGRMGSIFHPTVFISSDIYRTERFKLNYRYAMDYELLSRLLIKDFKFKFVDATISYMDPFGISERAYRKAIYETAKAYHQYFPRASYINDINMYFKLLKNIMRKKLESILGSRVIELYRNLIKSRYS